MRVDTLIDYDIYMYRVDGVDGSKGNGENLSSSQAQLGQATYLAVA